MDPGQAEAQLRFNQAVVNALRALHQNEKQFGSQIRELQDNFRQFDAALSLLKLSDNRRTAEEIRAKYKDKLRPRKTRVKYNVKNV